MIVTDEEGLAGMDWNEEDGPSLLAARREYDCVICNQTTPSTEDKPMGLVVLVQVSIAQYIHVLLQVSAVC
jgi:E3 ubiquitin-protein ligase UBR3